jgi:programmed cell death 6-interacting protein
MSTAFFTLQKKRADKLDWVKPLEAFIRREYGQAVLETHRVALNDLNQLRENVRGNGCSGDELMKYVGLLSSLMMRVPISEDNVRVAFVWFDSFGKNKKTQSFSVWFEQASVLFNLGTVWANQASSQALTGDGLKQAAALFQRAAGVFDALKHDIDAHPQAADDLRGEALAMFVTLMLAQAQECFFLKAAEAKMKPAILCKLSQQTADYYDTTCLQLESAAIKALVDGAWAVQARLKQLMYAAQTQLYLAAAECEARNFGKQVGLLRAAIAALNDVKKRQLQKRAPPPLLTAFDRLCAEAGQALGAAEHDNDVIYNDVVPDTLPTTESKSMVKATPFANTVEFKDPFADLVPYAVRAAASLYADKRQAKLNPVMAAIDEHNDMLKGTLASLGLPGALDALDTPTGVPQALAQKAERVRSRGGVNLLLDLQEQRDKLARRNADLLSEAVVILDEEEERDRSQAMGRRTPSHTLNSALRQEAAKHASYTEHASKSDKLVTKRLETTYDDLATLCLPVADLLKQLPSQPRAKGGVDADAVRELRRLLAELDALLERRRELRQQTLKTADSEEITSKLVLGGDPDAVFARELAKYDAMVQPLQDTFAAQQKLLEQLQVQNDRFAASRASHGGGAGERERVIQRLDNAARAFDGIEQNFNEGIKFHTTFATLLSPFKTKCEQFANARDLELLQIASAAAAAPAPGAPQFGANAYPGQQQPSYNPSYDAGYAPGMAPSPLQQQLQQQQPYYQQAPQYQQPMQPQYQQQQGMAPPAYQFAVPQQQQPQPGAWMPPTGPYFG